MDEFVRARSQSFFYRGGQSDCLGVTFKIPAFLGGSFSNFYTILVWVIFIHIVTEGVHIRSMVVVWGVIFLVI